MKGNESPIATRDGPRGAGGGRTHIITDYIILDNIYIYIYTHIHTYTHVIYQCNIVA